MQYEKIHIIVYVSHITMGAPGKPTRLKNNNHQYLLCNVLPLKLAILIFMWIMTGLIICSMCIYDELTFDKQYSLCRPNEVSQILHTYSLI